MPMLPWILFVIAAIAAVMLFLRRSPSAAAQLAGGKDEGSGKLLEAARQELQQAKDEIHPTRDRQSHSYRVGFGFLK